MNAPAILIALLSVGLSSCSSTSATSNRNKFYADYRAGLISYDKYVQLAQSADNYERLQILKREAYGTAGYSERIAAAEGALSAGVPLSTSGALSEADSIARQQIALRSVQTHNAATTKDWVPLAVVLGTALSGLNSNSQTSFSSMPLLAAVNQASEGVSASSAHNYSSQVNFGSSTHDSNYIGQLTANPYVLGGMGNEFHPNSISNRFGRYGSKFSPYSATNPFATNAPILIDSSGNYRGKLSANRFDPDSISNPFGRYGSPYSSESINNRFGPGSPYRHDSPNNPYGQGLRVYGQ